MQNLGAGALPPLVLGATSVYVTEPKLFIYKAWAGLVISSPSTVAVLLNEASRRDHSPQAWWPLSAYLPSLVLVSKNSSFLFARNFGHDAWQGVSTLYNCQPLRAQNFVSLCRLLSVHKAKWRHGTTIVDASNWLLEETSFRLSLDKRVSASIQWPPKPCGNSYSQFILFLPLLLRIVASAAALQRQRRHF